MPSSSTSLPLRSSLADPDCLDRMKISTGTLCFVLQPRIALNVLPGIVRVEINKTTLNLPVADLEYIAPVAGAVRGNAGAPRAVAVLAVTGPLADHEVAPREDPVEVRVVVGDRLDGPANI